MEGGHIPFRGKLRKIQHEGRATCPTQKRDHGRRVERDECHRIQGFIHELYQELLNLAVAARSVLYWALPQVSSAHSLQGLPLANDRVSHSPANQSGLDDRSEKGSDKTAAYAFSPCEPPSTAPDALESEVPGQDTRRECGPVLTRLPTTSWTANVSKTILLEESERLETNPNRTHEAATARVRKSSSRIPNAPSRRRV
jgi:hypothetical protein